MKLLVKILLVISIVTPSAIFIATYSSCKKDKCKGVSCQNGGICYNGSCTCAAGYEGANCSVPWRNKFLGNWTQVDDSIPASRPQFQVSVLADSTGIDSVIIVNFDNNFTDPIIAYVTSSDSLVIPPQLTAGILVEGSAYYISGSDIAVNYKTLNILTNVLDTVNAKW